MKKILATIMAVCMMLALVACSGKSEKNVITGYTKGDVTLGQYKGLTYTAQTVEVTDEDIEKQLNNFLALNAERKDVTDRTDIREADYANIDYKGTKDGVAFDGGTAEDFDLLIGSHQFIDGFEDGLIGKNVGETVVLDLTFPENYQSEELAGQAVQFEVKINKISKMQMPELTDELVASKTSCSTIEEYRDQLAANLKSSRESDAVSNRDYQLVQALIANCTFNIDLNEQIEKSKNDMIAQYNAMYQQSYGADAATVFYYTYGMDESSFNAYMLQTAETNTKYAYAVSAIAEAEGTTSTDAEAAELANRMLSSYGYNTVDELYAALKDIYGMDGKAVVAEQVKLNKAADIITNTAVAEAAE